MSALQPPFGKVTFESEGTEKGPFHSRILHVPSTSSGLTIGRGYDMKMKTAIQIQQDLIKAGVKVVDAKLLAKASGLTGPSAKLFISSNKLSTFEISQQQQVNLFQISYLEEELETKRICTKPDVVAKYGKCEWTKLDSALKEILIDLKFRGDYTGKTRKFLQKHVANNDTKGFLSVLANPHYWISQRVPTDRFQRRVRYFKSNAVFKP